MSKKFLSIHNHCSKSKLALAIQILMCCEAIAAPIGGEIVGGTGTITQQGSETAIIQDTERLAIDWQNFDVGKDERVTFVQPGQSAIALNRILSDKGSEILGQIDANGHVILVNPQGVVFKEGAVVNAGGLIASGLQINPDDFMNGDLIFKHLEGTDGTVINAGTINAAAGGNVALIGTQVENRGLISAHLSTVTLSSGKGAVLSFDDAGLLSVKVNEAMLQSELGDKAAVTNAGQIQAEGGRVLLSANTTRDVFSQAVNWGDRQQARSVTYNDDGSFTLGAGGDVVNSGDITVSGKTAGDVVVLGENVAHSGTIKANAIQGRGGNIELHANTTTKVTDDGLITANAEQGGDIKLLGENVGLFDQAAIAATGEKGGGRVLLGGDQEGLNPQIRNAEFAYISENSNIDASATDAGDGGVAIIFAEDTARIYGNLSAKGGATGGDGGFVETSGKRGFSIANTPDVTTVKGNGGHWLIDPYNITIASDGSEIPDDGIFTSSEEGAYLSVVKIKEVLSDGINVTVQTGGDGGNITVSALIDPELTSDATLNLFSNGNIFINADITPASDVGGKLNLNLYANAGGAGGDIKFNVNKDGDPLFKDGDPLFLNNIKINTNGGEFVVGHLASEGNETPLIWKIDPMKSGASNVDFSRSTINTRSELGAGKFSVNASGKVTLGDMSMFNDGGHYADLTILAKQLIFHQGQAQLNGQNIKLEAAEWRVGDKKDLSELELKAHAGSITLTVSESDLSENDLSGMRLETHHEGSIILDFSFTSSESLNEFKLPRLNSSADITLKGVTTDEKGFVLVNEEEKNPWDNPSWREFSLDGLLRLELGENGSATIGDIAGARSLAINSGKDIDLKTKTKTKTNGSISLGKIDVAGDFALDANGEDIRQLEGASLNVVGSSQFSSNKNVSLNNDNNTFRGTVFFGEMVKHAVLKARKSVKLVDNDGSLEVQATGDIAQEGAIRGSNVSITLASDENITPEGSNQFSSVVINKAKVATIRNSKDLHIGGVTEVDTLNLHVEGNLTQGAAIDVNQLSLDISGSTSLENDQNKIGGLSGSKLSGGKISAAGSLKINDLTIFNETTINASGINVAGQVHLTDSADLIFNNLANFALTGRIAGGTSVTANGNGQGSLQGPNSAATWKINVADQQHTLSTKEQGEITFSGMTVLKGGEQDDTFEFYGNEESNINFSKIDGGGGENTLDYSKFNSDVNITVSRSAQYVDIISGIQVLVGNGDRATLQALDGIGSIWSISDDGESNFITWSPNEDADEPTELFGGEMVFRGFNNISGGPAADEFKVALPASVSSTTYMYTLDGGGGKDSLIIKDGGTDWMGTYGVDQNSGPDQNSVPGFTFSFLGEERIKVDYKEIENINLTADLDEMTVRGESSDDRIQLGNRWWQLNNFQAVDYTDGLQKLTVKGGGGSISLVRKENGAASPDGTDEPLPKENINFPNELEIVGGSLEFDENVSLNTGHLHLEGLKGGVGTMDSRLRISVDTLKLTDNTGDLYLREDDGLALAGVVNGGLVDLVVLEGVLSQNDAISRGEEGQLIFKAVTGAIRLDHEDNSIAGPITLHAGTDATLYTMGNLVLGGVTASNLDLRASGSIESTNPIVVNNVASFVSGADIDLKSASNELNDVTISPINKDAKMDVHLASNGNLRVFNSNVHGKLDLTAGRIYFLGLTNANTLVISAPKVWVTGLVIIDQNVQFNDALVEGLEFVHSENGEIYGARKLSTADQMIEVEWLAEVDPAIFTNVKNYVYQDISIRLPSDQLYEEMITE